MTRFHKLPNGSTFRYRDVWMIKRSMFSATTYSHILGKDRIISIFMRPFAKVEVVKK
jgi:hypothetical protein